MDAIIASLSGKASVRAGWSAKVFFEIEARYFDKLGHIAVELELADRRPREGMQRLLVEFQTEPALLEDIAAGLRRAVELGDTTPLQLTGVDA